ncbi:hypothetical protein Tsubulata_000195 [Turnera subulata]|uniref:Uncharacterized protein n=1 Tax=Turnera subulata TaxID=218843 RepID=A0A9Q0GD61_9ROSI|nr:hypothetical protein Tsubulata_000195 [Turnera subulata]
MEITKSLSFSTYTTLLVMLLSFLAANVSEAARLNRFDPGILMPTEQEEPDLDVDGDGNKVGTRWVVLVAGSNGYGNYRHHADVCHA